MRAGHTVLTHFSGRLEKRTADVWGLGMDEALCGTILLAFDFMTIPINPKKLKKIATLTRPLHTLFSLRYAAEEK